MKATKEDLENLIGGSFVTSCKKCGKVVSSGDVEIISEITDKYGIWYNYSCRCVKCTTGIERWKNEA